MDAIKQIITEYGIEILGIIITAIFGYVTTKLRGFLNDKVKKSTADAVVGMVEQLYKNSSSADKLEHAKGAAISILSKKGIKIDETELNVLIENAVYASTNAYKNLWADPILSVGDVEEMPAPLIDNTDENDWGDEITD